ncbi:hypothetical protein Efla_002090 [Eimeria flavescens]
MHAGRQEARPPMRPSNIRLRKNSSSSSDSNSSSSSIGSRIGFVDANKLSLRTNRVKSAQHFVAKAVKAIKDSKRVRVQRNRMVKKQRKPEARVYCVVRNSRKGGCRATREALARLGLTRPYSCTFIANDKEANATLRKVSPFVFYGLPKEDTVRRLFLTRGCMRVEGEGETAPQPLSDNVMVEEAFGSLGIVCLEDLIDEVVTCGPHFKEVMQKVGKFQLADLKAVEGLEAKRVEFGFLGAKIDVKITQLT